MSSSEQRILPPGPKSWFSLRHLLAFRRDGIQFMEQLARNYGDIAQFRIGPLRIILINHPDYIKEVLTTQHTNFTKGRPLEMAKALVGEGLLTSEGDFHKRQSRALQPAFHRKMIESYATSMTEYATQLTRCWEDGMTVDMLDEMVRMSTAIAGKALFGAEVEEEAEAINQALQDALSLFGRIAIPYSEQLLQLPLPGSIRFRRAKARLDATIDRMIEKRRNTDLDNGDLLSILLQENEAGGMSDQQIRDEALTLFLTAFDTTSLALTWTWYLLAQNPEAEAELQAEVDQVLEGRTPTVEDLPQLKYTRMVLGESMRVRPPLYVISRQARETFQLGSYTIPAGSILLISPYLIHHDPRFRPNPDQFDPHSWDKHAQQASSKYEYIPFSRGPRACIGESFAWMEGVLVLATIAQSWHLKLVPGHPVEFLQLINLRPKYGMKMTVHRRDRKA